MTPDEVIRGLLARACDGAALDIEAFSDAAAKIEATGNSASDLVKSILDQVDGVLYASPLDGKIRLVRIGGGS